MSYHPFTLYERSRIEVFHQLGYSNRNMEVELGVSLYFADPYPAWQRGSNENLNGILRGFYPKKTNLALANQKTVDAYMILNQQQTSYMLGLEITYVSLSTRRGAIDLTMYR